VLDVAVAEIGLEGARVVPLVRQRVPAAITPLSLQRGRFRAPDKLIAMLKAVGGSKNYAE